MTDTVVRLETWGARPALIDARGHALSFAAFAALSQGLAGQLQSEGIMAGQRWVVLAELGAPLYAGIAALFQLGAVVVLVDPWAPADYLAKALSQVEADGVLVGGKARLFLARKSFRAISRRLSLDKLLAKKSPALKDVAPRSDDDTALITFTSGSSGKPKGFDRTHGFLRAQQAAHEKYFDHAEGDVDLCMYPVFVLSNLRQGMTSVLIDAPLRDIAKADMARVFAQINRHRVTSISLSPTLLRMLIHHARDTKSPFPLKKIFSGGAPVDPQLLAELEAISPTTHWTVVYGSTEAEPIALLKKGDVPLEELLRASGYPLGRLVPDLRLKWEPLEDVHPWHTSPPGEVIITGDFVGKRYWRNEEAFNDNKIVDADGTIWHRTGDMAYQQDGFLYLVGRRHNSLPTPQGALFPLPLEKRLEALPGVRKAALLNHGGETLAVIQGRPPSAVELHHALGDFEARVVHAPIPLDSRHRAKIDHQALRLTLERNMDATSPLHERLLAYTKERFPLPAIALFVFLLTTSAAAVSHHLTGWPLQWNEPRIWVAITTVFLLMMQLRLMDEIKDYDKDRQAYPERLLSRGIITLPEIRRIIGVVMGLQVGLNLFMASDMLWSSIAMLTFALAMAKEFGVGEFLNRHLGLYLFTHQLILPFIVGYAAVSIAPSAAWYSSPHLLWALLTLSLPSTVYEIARKTWSPDRESPLADSYTRVWGRQNTVMVTSMLATLQIYALSRLPGITQLHLAGVTFAGCLWLGLATVFLRAPTRKNSKLVEHGGSLFLLVAHALNLVCFALT